MSENISLSTEQKREIGKGLFLNSEGDPEKRKSGLRLLLEAHEEKDYEATYIISRLMLDGLIVDRSELQTEHALILMQSAANSGCVQARAYLNAYCTAHYKQQFNSQKFGNVSSGPLVDFDGNPIKIDRQGIFTPIDAVLEYKDGQNILTLSTNVAFVGCDEIEDFQRFGNAVIKGILAWEGDYDVFGGQKVSVRINLTNDDRTFDNLLVMAISGDMGKAIRSVSDRILPKDHKAQVDSVIEYKRSFASVGLKWSANSRKFIFLQSEDGKFDDYKEIMHVAKHEFGHALGLGDLYPSQVDHLKGVEKGTYTELDCYAISDCVYNLAMCDHRGPISNNDIEMVILAFKENKIQLYQQGKVKGKISSALGKGN